MSNMGARVGRLLRNFNLENRVAREISKEKPSAAPRHAASSPAPAPGPGAEEVTDSIHRRDDPLLSLLKTVYVDSTDPAAAEAPKPVETEEERRPLKFSLPGDPYGLVEVTDVPKGKLTIIEALKTLNSHKLQPQTWTPEKIAQEYSLPLKDTKALIKFFIPFDVKIIPPRTGDAKQIKGS